MESSQDTTVEKLITDDDPLFPQLRRDCAIFSELAYQEADYVQKCWHNAARGNVIADTLRGLARGELILPPGLAAHARHVDLLRRCTAFAPEYCGGSSLETDAVMYIIPYNFTSDASQPDRSPDIIILAFGGTNSLKSLFVTDFGFPELINLDNEKLDIFDHAILEKWGNVKVDLGFALYLRWLLQNDLQTLCDKDGLLDLINIDASKTELCNALRTRPIICTGHSLGGAASTLAALYLKMKCPGRDVGFINMGSPRVGNSPFANMVNAELSGIKCRVVIGRDPVVDLPPDLTSQLPNALSGIFNYAHAGDKYEIGSESGIPLLDHLIAMYIHNLPEANSQDGELGTSAVERVLSQKERRLANRWKGQLKSEYDKASDKAIQEVAKAAGTAEDGVTKVAAVAARVVEDARTQVAADSERASQILAQWIHI